MKLEIASDHVRIDKFKADDINICLRDVEFRDVLGQIIEQVDFIRILDEFDEDSIELFMKSKGYSFDKNESI